MSEYDDMREIEAKLEILRERARKYDQFVAPQGQPPLLWQMAMLADAGFTVLPRVDDPDPDRSFPEATIEMRELDWSPDHRCLVGGESFDVMAVPPSYHGHLIRPKPVAPRYYSIQEPAEPSFPWDDQEHYRAERIAVAHRGTVRWQAEMMVCQGSRAAELARNRALGQKPVGDPGE